MAVGMFTLVVVALVSIVLLAKGALVSAEDVTIGIEVEGSTKTHS